MEDLASNVTTTSNNKLFIKQLSSSYVLYGVNLLLMVLVTPFLLERLGAEPYGIWLLCQNIATYFNLFNLGFLSNAIAQYATNTPDNPEAKNQLFSTLFYALILFCSVSFPAYWYIHEHFETLFKISAAHVSMAKNVFSVVYIAFITLFLASTFDMILYYVLGNVMTKNLIEIIRLLVLNAGYVAIILWGGEVFDIAIFYLIIQVIVLICLYFFAQREAKFQLSFRYFNFTLFKSFFKPGFNFLLLNLANMVIFAGDNIMISALIGVEQLVLFSLSFKLSDIAIRLINKIVDVKSPLMINYIKAKEYGLLKMEFNKLIYWSLVLSFIAMLGISLFGKMALNFWLGDKYLFDNTIIVLFAIFVMVNSLYYVCWIFLNLTGQHTRLSYVVFIEIGLNIILSVFLSKSFGLAGIALGTIIASLLTSSWFAYWECKRWLKNTPIPTRSLSKKF
jgi:O-antigen/teichoic acid export membrane protein